jgi:hypothetical protein
MNQRQKEYILFEENFTKKEYNNHMPSPSKYMKSG